MKVALNSINLTPNPRPVFLYCLLSVVQCYQFQVTVLVKDVNDNAPVFTTPSVMSVPEDRPINQVAFVVTAEDKDFGNNSAVIFSLSYHHQAPFRINPTTGEMLVNTALDRETTQNYTVTVTAYDLGNPAMSSVQSLTIKISDINDNNPIFNPTTYNKVIAENTIIGTTLVTVTATDHDEGLNGNVRYFIVGGDDNFDFTIDKSSGVIRVQKNLNYERVHIYTLKVQAEDSGSVTRSAYADVTITILDVNDNKPFFVNSPYYPLVQEEADNIPVHVFQVSARDEDSIDNNKITYKFREGDKIDGETVFEIHNTSGEITCIKKLDREVLDEYQLIVLAQDSGMYTHHAYRTIHCFGDFFPSVPPCIFDQVDHYIKCILFYSKELVPLNPLI